jgi:hypothetical protein
LRETISSLPHGNLVASKKKSLAYSQILTGTVREERWILHLKSIFITIKPNPINDTKNISHNFPLLRHMVELSIKGEKLGYYF